MSRVWRHRRPCALAVTATSTLTGRGRSFRGEQLTLIGQQSPATLQRVAVDPGAVPQRARRADPGTRSARSRCRPTSTSSTRAKATAAVPAGATTGASPRWAATSTTTATSSDIALALEGYDEGARLVFHEYTTCWWAMPPGSIPVWLNEGPAECITARYALEPGGTRAPVSAGRLTATSERARDALPLPAQLIAVDTASALYNEGERRSAVPRRGMGADALPDDRRCRNGRPRSMPTPPPSRAATRPMTAFREAFGTGPAEFEPELRRYVQRSTFRSTVFVLPQRVHAVAPDPGAGSRPATPARGWATCSSVASDAATRRRRGIEAARQRRRPRACSACALGLLRLDQDRIDEAWPAFERAVAAAPGRFLSRDYAYGVSRG